ncbi:MAG: tail fiber domain-containing protein [Microcoleaceae cyanobacterium]
MPLRRIGQVQESDIVTSMASEVEIAAALNAHVAAADPHPGYLSQSEGDARYRLASQSIPESAIDSLIARDSEVTAALSAHLAATDPHPAYLSQTEGDARYSIRGADILFGGYVNSNNAHVAFHKPQGSVSGLDRYYFRKNVGGNPLDNSNFVDLFQVRDDGVCLAANGFANLSDRRVKFDISPLDYGIAQINALRPCSYFLKMNPSKKKLGLIAQEVEEIIPEICYAPSDEGAGDHWALDYSGLIPILIKAIQELVERVDQLERNLPVVHTEGVTGSNPVSPIGFSFCRGERNSLKTSQSLT